jgi:hypothetical protein
MAQAIRIHTTVESENLRIPELAALVGKRVEVIVVEDDAGVGESRNGTSAAHAAPARERVLGSLRGLLHVPDDFNDPLPEDVLRAFEGDA